MRQRPLFSVLQSHAKARLVSQSVRAMASGSNASPMGKLSLSPRFSDEDVKLLKATMPKFKNFLRSMKEREEGGGVEEGGSAMMEAEINAYAPSPGSIVSLEAAEELISSSISAGVPSAGLHVLASMQHDLVLPHALSQDVLALVMERGSLRLMMDLRRLLHRSTAPLTLNQEDIGDCIAYCLFKNAHDEAFQWYLVMEDTYRLPPTSEILSLLLPGLAKAPSWERLFYVTGEAARLRLPLAARTRFLLLQECDRTSQERWRYVSLFLADLDSVGDADDDDAAAATSHDSSGSSDDVGSNNDAATATAGKCVGLALRILAREHRHAQVLAQWEALGREGKRGAAQQDRTVVHSVAAAATVMGRWEVVQELSSIHAGGNGDGNHGGSCPESFAALAATEEDSTNTPTSSSSSSVVSLAALSYLLFMHPEAPTAGLQRLRVEEALLGREGEALALLAHTAAAVLGPAPVSRRGSSSSSSSVGLGLEPARWQLLSELCGQCLDALGTDHGGEGERRYQKMSTTDGHNSSSSRDHDVSPQTAGHLVRLMCEAVDVSGLLRLLEECGSISNSGDGGAPGVELSLPRDAFMLASEFLLHHGERAAVLALLESHLSMDRNSHAAPSGASGSPLAVYGPAVEALALEGDFDVMVHLLLHEIPSRHRSNNYKQQQQRWPSAQLFLRGMGALSKAGRHEDAVELFKIAITGPDALTHSAHEEEEVEDGGSDGAGDGDNLDHDRNDDGEERWEDMEEEGGGSRDQAQGLINTPDDGDSVEEELTMEISVDAAPRPSRPYPAVLAYPPSPALVHAALDSCAQAFLGEDSLQIMHLVGRATGGFVVSERAGVPRQGGIAAGAATRDVECIIMSLATPHYVAALPSTVAYLRSSNRPVAVGRRLHELCLAAALWAGDEDTALHFLDHQRHDEEQHRTLNEEERQALLASAIDTAWARFSYGDGRGGSESDRERLVAFAACL